MKATPYKLLAAAGVLLFYGSVAGVGRSAERDAVVPVGGCTGFVVEGDLLVTAKHCRHPETISVPLQGKTVSGRRVYVPEGDDGPVVFRLEGGPYESLPFARRKPEVGEAVYSLGYPGGNWARIEGKVVGGDGKDVNYTNHRIATGNSGGPLLNADGEVIGVALSVATDVAVHRSVFAGWSATTAALRAAQSRGAAGNGTPVVVVFASERCAPCRRLERDVKAGRFRGYDFRFVTWNEKTERWSHPDLYREFWTSCRPKPDGLAFPTIWVRGTDRYRVGYSAERRNGLLNWLAGAVKHLLEGLFGGHEPIRPPIPEGGGPAPPPENGTPSPAPTQELVDKLVRDLAAFRDDAKQTRADFQQFRDAGVVGKIRAIARLKSDKDVALERLDAVKSDVESLRGGFRERPLQFLWGLLGILSGLVHRRFAG